MSIGLDLGSTQFRSLRQQADSLVGRMCRLEYAAIPDSLHHRRLLDRDGVSYGECDGALVLLGDDAVEWGHLLHAPLTPLLPDGQLPAHDPLARQILSLMLDAVLPPPSVPNEVCCFTVPGELLPDENGCERGFFRQLVALRGYQPRMIGQGLAVVLAELSDSAFSGLGITLGATQCEFALARSGQEFARCAIPWGSAELNSPAGQDESSNATSVGVRGKNPGSSANAERRNANAERVGLADSSHSTTSTTAGISDSAIIDFLVELLLEAGLRIGQNDGFRLLTEPVSIACAGGLASRSGFEGLWQQAWHRAAWPLRIRGLRIATDAAYTVARGCLIQAKLASQPKALRAAA